MDIKEAREKLDTARERQPSFSLPERNREIWQEALGMAFHQISKDQSTFSALVEIAKSEADPLPRRHLAGLFLLEAGISGANRAQKDIINVAAREMNNTAALRETAQRILTLRL